MKKVAGFNNAERKELFAETATAKGITPMAAEKDFWICWVLMVIFEHPRLSTLLRFKGGTSLSKCFGVINRFSEDIDLILDWSALTNEDPKRDRSKSKQDKLNKDMNEAAQKFIQVELLPILQEQMKGYCTANIDPDKPHNIKIKYPPIYDSKYMANEILLEIGPLAEMVPSDFYPVSPYAAEEFPDLFEQKSVTVMAIKPERTFWEKITILHAEAHRPVDKEQQQRYSRHYYDVHKMLGTKIEVDALNNLSLLDDVVAFKDKFYPSAWARYDLAKLSTIRLVPADAVKAGLEKDYKEMREMLFEKAPPNFNDIMQSLNAFETKLHDLAKGA